MHDARVDHLRKAPVLRELVITVQAGGRDAAFAWTLLWLGLWPGLDALRNRRQRRGFRNDGELTSMIVENFSVAVRRLELNGCGAVAATLVLNTERLLVAARRRAKRKRAQEREAATLLLEDAHRDTYPSPTLATVTAHLALRDLSPDDRQLVMLIVSGFSAHELGAMLCATEAAIWKRIERVRSSIRTDEFHAASASPKKSTKTMSGNPRGQRF